MKRLTAAEWDALCGAFAYGESRLDDNDAPGFRTGRERAALNRAFVKVVDSPLLTPAIRQAASARMIARSRVHR